MDIADLLTREGVIAEHRLIFIGGVLALNARSELKAGEYLFPKQASVRQVVDFYQLPVEELLVVCDDINLPLGKLRARARGTHGGHNGLRDIQQHLGTTAYARLRIGVDAPGSDDAIDHVLGRFKPGERAVIKDAIALAAQAVMVWVKQGVQVCMNQYNGSDAKKE